MPQQADMPRGDPDREAVDSLGGYVYQLYQSALSWTELDSDAFLYLEVAEDFAVTAEKALKAVQVKDTAASVTINSADIVASINSFVDLKERNPNLDVTLRHLTTSNIGKEKKSEDRIDDTPTLISWRKLAKAGDLSHLRKILEKSKLSKKAKQYIQSLDDKALRKEFLQKIHFDCGAPDKTFLARQLNARVSHFLIQRGGVHSQASNCVSNILLSLLKLTVAKTSDERLVDRNGLEELLESATQITLNKAQFEANNQLIQKALLSAAPQGVGLTGAQFVKPSAITADLMPKALADRKEIISRLRQSLAKFGLCWITGAAGMGKTLAARLLANNNDGDWVGINLRAQTSQQVALALTELANSLSTYGIQGLVIDDLDCAIDQPALDSLIYLFHSASRSDVLLVITASKSPPSELLFATSLDSGITHTLAEFSVEDIQQILEKMEVSDKRWAKYIHLVSGGGHPQLAIAFIQSMVDSGWNEEELRTLKALFSGSTAIQEVRRRTRERLLNDLSSSSRCLIERVSLKLGSFKRELALNLGKISPPIPDAGIVLDGLIGSWLDQHEDGRYSLSPLLSDYAAKTLTEEDKAELHHAIAGSLVSGTTLDVVDMDSAFLAALLSKNNGAIAKLCMALLSSEISDLEMITPHLQTLRLLRTDISAYPSDAAISQMVRGAQLLLLNQETGSSKSLQKAMDSFIAESRDVADDAMRSTMEILIYSKLLIHTSRAGIGVNFISVITRLEHLLENESQTVPSGTLTGFGEFEDDGVTPLAFMFLNQVRQLPTIDALSVVFEYLDNSGPTLREKLLKPFDHDDFDIDMLVSGAWLSEHNGDTIDPAAHSALFARFEKQAVSWNRNDLAICCRKYQAIIIDEYGNNKGEALNVLNEGLSIYGETNSELVRAKAKVLYRSEDHKESLALSKSLIESDAPLNEVEKAFLGRDAAISAEKQGDFETARKYYLYGSSAAKKSQSPDMIAMHVGLLADAALASWHNGDQLNCLQDLAAVLSELKSVSPEQTLRTAHCHAVTRHVLLWLYQSASGQDRVLADGQETKILPGCVSNPEPHPDIGSRDIAPLELAWYMLAAVEINVHINAGINDNLNRFLDKSQILEGEFLLNSAKMNEAMRSCDMQLFKDALAQKVSLFSFAQVDQNNGTTNGQSEFTFGHFPPATKKQQKEFMVDTEHYILLFFAMCIMQENADIIATSVLELSASNGFSARSEVFDRTQDQSPAPDFETGFAQLIYAQTSSDSDPRGVFAFVFKTLQLAQKTGTFDVFATAALQWLTNSWQYIWDHQRFLLNHPTMHEAKIAEVFGDKNMPPSIKVASVLRAIMPTMNFDNQHELEEILSNFPKNCV